MEKEKTVELRTPSPDAITQEYLVAKVTNSIKPKVGEFLSESRVRLLLADDHCKVVFNGMHGVNARRL